MPPKNNENQMRKQVVEKFQSLFSSLKKTGDLEEDNGCSDVAACFKMMCPDFEDFKAQLVGLQDRIRKLDSSWQPSKPLAKVICPTESTISFVVAPWQLGFESEHGVKGHSKLCQVIDVALQFLEKPFASKAEPLHLIMPQSTAVGQPIADFTLIHLVGFAKSCAARLVLLGAVKLDLNDQQLSLILNQLKQLYAIHALCDPAESYISQIDQALIHKLVAAERTRPDALQIWQAFQNKAKATGQELTVALASDYFQQFANETILQSKQFSPMEQTAVKWLCRLTPESRSRLEYHWAQFRVTDSALPLAKLAALAEAHVSVVLRDPENNFFKEIFAWSDDKVQCMLVRVTGIWNYKLKMAVLCSLGCGFVCC